MSKKFRVLLMACMSMLLCVSAIAMGTYALFTDKVTIDNHLKAGTMNVTLKRTNLEWNCLNGNGYLETDSSDEIVDFTNKTSRNIFDLNDETLITPMCYYEATMELSNLSDVAYGYWIDVVLSDDTPSELAKQLKVEITTYDEENNEVVSGKFVSEGLSVGSKTEPIDEVPATAETQTFKVKITFVNGDENNNIDNNVAMNKEVKFDIIVNAIQLTTPLN